MHNWVKNQLKKRLNIKSPGEEHMKQMKRNGQWFSFFFFTRTMKKEVDFDELEKAVDRLCEVADIDKGLLIDAIIDARFKEYQREMNGHNELNEPKKWIDELIDDLERGWNK